jgi:hypothetical protein
MKKILTVVGIATALTLSGCSMLPGAEAKPSESQSAEATAPVTADAIPSESASAEPTEEATTEPTAPDGTHYASDFETGVMSDTDFVKLVRERTTAMTDVGDGAILLIPGKACASLANGETFVELLEGTSESIQTSIESETGAPAEYTPAIGTDAGFIVGAGVMNYCPQFEETLKSQIPHTNQ